MNKNNLFIIENGYNTCYISALLVGLFHKPSFCDEIITNIPNIKNIIYLQEVIKHKFIINIRNNLSVTIDAINEINLMFVAYGLITYNELLKECNICKLFEKLMEKTNMMPLELSSGDNLYYISVSCASNINNTNTVKNIIDDWKKTHTIVNNPLIIGIHINRQTTENKCSFSIDIQYKIKFSNDEGDVSSLAYSMKWSIHSIICYKQIDDIGHYYCFLHTSKNKWLLFDDLNIPCSTEITIKEYENIIKIECVFLIYTYIDIGFT